MRSSTKSLINKLSNMDRHQIELPSIYHLKCSVLTFFFPDDLKLSSFTLFCFALLIMQCFINLPQKCNVKPCKSKLWLHLFLKLILLLSEIALYALDVYYNQTYLNQQSKYIDNITVYCVNQRQRELNFTISWLLPEISVEWGRSFIVPKWFKLWQMVSVMIQPIRGLYHNQSEADYCDNRCGVWHWWSSWRRTFNLEHWPLHC